MGIIPWGSLPTTCGSGTSRASISFQGGKPEKFDGNNDETFNKFDEKSWAKTVADLDAVMTEWEKAVEAADEAKVALWASRIARNEGHR